MVAIGGGLWSRVLATVLVIVLAHPAGAASYETIYSFKGGSDGIAPLAALTEVGTLLYGTTSGGGGTTACNSFDDGCGTVFTITKKGAETVLYAFQGGSDGASPAASLLDVAGTLYGTTTAGGDTQCAAAGCGTVFAIDLATEDETVLYAFKGGADGQGPQSALIDVRGTLYGTTPEGGGSTGCFTNVPGCGVVYKITPQNVEKVLHVFAGFASDGGQPTGSLLNVSGTLYGTTLADRGTVFKTTRRGAATVLHYFAGGSDGSGPRAGLVDVDGTLYGTTVQGGGTGCPIGSFDNGCGTVFAVDPATGEVSVL